MTATDQEVVNKLVDAHLALIESIRVQAASDPRTPDGTGFFPSDRMRELVRAGGHITDAVLIVARYEEDAK